MQEPPLYTHLATYIGLIIFIVIGRVRDFFGKIFYPQCFKHLQIQNGFAPLNSDYDNFYVRRIKGRINECFARPITGVPGRFVTLLDRESADGGWHWKPRGTVTRCLNLSSYNYLGFAQSQGSCVDADEEAIRTYGVSFAGCQQQGGTAGQVALQMDTEQLVADFVGKPAAVIFSMGFGTNAIGIPALLDEDSFIISDELNHASIRLGARLSGARLQTFKHNDMKDLERTLRSVIQTDAPKKIMVLVEGLYSMEGTLCPLPALLALKKVYKFYLFVDEAHSIGALGNRGRGVCDLFGVDPAEVDVLMGTFSKSFGACGGYIASSKQVVHKIKSSEPAGLAELPSPAVLTQIAAALRHIASSTLGKERLDQLAFNSRYLRAELKKMGFIVYGDDVSPIIPLLLFNTGKMPAFSQEMLRRKIAVVVVAYPATSFLTARARLCVSAAHTKSDLDRVLSACDEIGDRLLLKYVPGQKKLEINMANGNVCLKGSDSI